MFAVEESAAAAADAAATLVFVYLSRVDLCVCAFTLAAASAVTCTNCTIDSLRRRPSPSLLSLPSVTQFVDQTRSRLNIHRQALHNSGGNSEFEGAKLKRESASIYLALGALDSRIVLIDNN